MRLLRLIHPRHSYENGKMARLVEAERELEDLQDRANRAIAALDERQAKNHWRESIQRMIEGNCEDG